MRVSLVSRTPLGSGAIADPLSSEIAGKVAEVKEGKAEVTSNKGNTISKNGTKDDPAVVIERSGVSTHPLGDWCNADDGLLHRTTSLSALTSSTRSTRDLVPEKMQRKHCSGIM